MVLKELLLRLGFDVDTQALSDTFKKVDNLKQGLERVANVAQKMAVALTEAITETAEYAGAVDDLSKSTGLSTDTLQELKHVAQLSGASFETLKKGVLTLSKNAFEATTSSEEMAQAFRRVGVSVRDASGKLKPAEELLGDVAERFKAMPPGVQRTALVMKLFGEAGTTLVPLLEEGKDGIAALRAEARELGVVLDSSTIKAGADFGDALDRLHAAVRGVRMAIAGPLISAVTPWLDLVRKWLSANRQLIAQRVHQALAVVADGLRRAHQLAQPWLAALKELVTNTWALAGAGVALGGVIAQHMLFGLANLAGGALKTVAGLNSLVGSIGPALRELTNLRKVLNTVTVAQLAAAAGPALMGAAVALLVAGIVLLADEIRVLIKGGDTLMGRFSNWLDQPMGAIDTFGGAATELFRAIMGLIRDLSTGVLIVFAALAGDEASWNFIKEKWQGVVDFLMDMWGTVSEFVQASFQKLLDLPGQAAEGLKGLLADLPGAGFFLEAGRNPEASQPAAALFGGGASPDASVANSTTNRTTSITNAPQVTVQVQAQTGASAEEIGGQVEKAVGRALEQQFSTAALVAAVK